MEVVVLGAETLEHFDKRGVQMVELGDEIIGCVDGVDEAWVRIGVSGGGRRCAGAGARLFSGQIRGGGGGVGNSGWDDDAAISHDGYWLVSLLF